MERNSIEGIVYHYKKAEINKPKGIIVFVHGFATTSNYHLNCANDLKEYDYYAIELPGHGYSKIETKKVLSPYNLAMKVIRWIELLNLDDIYLIGHSMGGGIVNIVASKIPERISKVVAVTPMNSSFSLKLRNIYKFVPKTLKATWKMEKIILKEPERFYPNKLNDEGIIKELNYQKENRANFKLLRKNMASLNNLKILKGCEENNFLKTLVLLGKYDQIIYWKTAHKRFSELKNYELYVFENSAHLPFWEEFELYKQKVLEFIERE